MYEQPDITIGKGERTRAMLLAVAYEQFVNNGYHGTSMRSIANSAGITVGAIYNHFDGKEDMFKAVILAYHPFTSIVPMLAQAEGDSIEELLHNSAQQFLRALDEYPGMLNLMFIEMVECGGQHLPELVNSFLPGALAFAQRVQSTSDQTLDLSPLVFIRTFLASLFAFYITEQLLRGAHLPGDIGDYEDFLDIYLHGILASTETTS